MVAGTADRLHRLVTALAIGGLLAGCGTWAAAAEPPRRVVSVNLCLDELAARLAAPGQLVAVSALAHDRTMSTIVDDVRDLPGVELRVEDLLALRPDLVIVDADTGFLARTLLRRQGISLLELPMAMSLQDAATQIERIGAALGRKAGADRVAAEMMAAAGREAAVAERAGGPRPLAAIWQPNGGTQGRGTLPDELLRRAGLRNLAAELGMPPFGFLSIETLLLQRPDLLVVDTEAGAATSLAELIQYHPALRAGGSIGQVVGVPRRALVCAGPQSLLALQRLVAARSALGR